MTTDLDRAIERHIRSKDALMSLSAQLQIELAKTLPYELVGPTMRQKLETEHAALLAESVEAAIAYEQAILDLRRREVEAHERNSAFWTLQRERA